MAADRKVTVEFEALANTAGAEKLTKEIAELEKKAPAAAEAVKKLQAAVAAVDTATAAAKNTNGLFIDGLGRLHDVSGKFVSAKKAENREIQEYLKANPAVNEANKRLADGHEKSAKGARNNGFAMLTLGRGIQDLQFGILGVLNNIEGMVMALGGGAGLAGVLTLVGVGISLLIPVIKSLAGESDEAAKKQAELAAKANLAANAAHREAQEQTAAAASAKTYAEGLEKIATAADSAAAALDRKLKVTEATRRAQLAESDAQAAAEMAEVDDALSRGAIGPQEAEKRRAEIERRSTSARHSAAQASAGDRISATLAQANAARVRAAQLAGAGDQRAAAAAGLLTDDERKTTTADRDAAMARAEQLEEAAGPGGSIEKEFKLKDLNNPARMAELRERRDKARRKAAEERAAATAAARTLAADKSARERTGLSNREAFENEQAGRRREIGGLLGTAADRDAEAEALRIQKGGEDRAFKLRTGATSMQHTGRLRDMDARDRAVREKMEQDRLRDKWQAGDGGQAAAAVKGEQNAGAQRTELAALMAEFVKNQKAEMAALNALVEVLRAGH